LDKAIYVFHLLNSEGKGDVKKWRLTFSLSPPGRRVISSSQPKRGKTKEKENRYVVGRPGGWKGKKKKETDLQPFAREEKSSHRTGRLTDIPVPAVPNRRQTNKTVRGGVARYRPGKIGGRPGIPDGCTIRKSSHPQQRGHINSFVTGLHILQMTGRGKG